MVIAVSVCDSAKKAIVVVQSNVIFIAGIFMVDFDYINIGVNDSVVSRLARQNLKTMKVYLLFSYKISSIGIRGR